MTTIDELVVGDAPQAWAGAGFAVDDDGVCRIGTVRCRLAGRADGKYLRGWSLRAQAEDADGGPGDVDGIPTERSDAEPCEPADHPNGTVAIDHVVIATPDCDRTVTALAEVGLEPLRTRETDTYGAPMRQTFFRLGEVVLEVVGPEESAGDGPTRFFGLALTVADLDATAAHYGDTLGRVKDAVQPGRRIATLRHKQHDLSVAIAFMTPEP